MKKLILILFIVHCSLFTAFAQHYYLYGEATAGGIYGKGVLFRFDPFMGKDTTLFNFNGANGSTPSCFLSLDKNKILYSDCTFGGGYSDGVLFSYNLGTGFENTILNFDSSNGAEPGGGGQE
jgi:hypothetical protein